VLDGGGSGSGGRADKNAEIILDKWGRLAPPFFTPRGAASGGDWGRGDPRVVP